MNMRISKKKYFRLILITYKYINIIFLTSSVLVAQRIGEGPGLETQAGKAYFNKYCFPNLH